MLACKVCQHSSLLPRQLKPETDLDSAQAELQLLVFVNLWLELVYKRGQQPDMLRSLCSRAVCVSNEIFSTSRSPDLLLSSSSQSDLIQHCHPIERVESTTYKLYSQLSTHYLRRYLQNDFKHDLRVSKQNVHSNKQKNHREQRENQKNSSPDREKSSSSPTRFSLTLTSKATPLLHPPCHAKLVRG